MAMQRENGRVIKGLQCPTNICQYIDNCPAAGQILSKMGEYDAIIGFLVVLAAVLGPFGVAVYWVAVTRTKMKALEKDVDNLKTNVNNLSVRVNTHIDVMNILTQMGILKGGESINK